MQALRIITEEHRNLWRIATTLDLVADEADAAGRVEEPFFTSVFDYIEQFMDRSHHAKEDEYLFRLLRQRSADAAALLDRLQSEHSHGPASLLALRAKLAQAADGGEARAAFT
ncbi:MAG: hemerythrin domain-containing protein, partial [Proteobacteria bacterium]|nr:hemerythrin domain-containing protein [Pseudomonadota bacterium]